MRPDAAGEQRVAREQQVVWGDGRGDTFACAAHELHGDARGDVLEDDAQPRHALCERRQDSIDEACLAVENFDVGRGDFTVHLCASVASSRRMSVTPASEWVVAPAG